MNHLSVHYVKYQAHYDFLREKWDKETRIIMDNVYNYYINELAHDQQKKMFHDWWYGKPVYTDKYKSSMSEEKFKEVSSCILEATSRGFG